MQRFVIVTPLLNGRRFLGETLLSIDRQSYPEWLHIVVDGGSTDGGVELVRQAGEPRRKLVTGQDRGLYDAVFKGFEAADARPDDILCWLAADDMLAPWAFATMAEAFARGADWVTGLPGQWDEAGRLTHVVSSAWFPKSLMRAGLFHGRALGWPQQESTFFSRRLLARADPAVIAHIRGLKYAGDFALWREFSNHAELEALSTMVGGFRLHGANMSGARAAYFAEAAREGALFPPRPVAALMRGCYRLAAIWVTYNRARAVAKAEDKRMRGS